MPGFDKTGPMGQGPMTGGGFGRCAGARASENMELWDRGALRGAGRGGQPWGGGRGRCFGGGRSRGRWGAGMQRLNPKAMGDSASQAQELLDALELENEKLRGRLAELEAKLKE